MMLLLSLLLIAQTGATASGRYYQPLAVGDTWTYRTEVNGSKTEVVRKITGKRPVGDKMAFVMESQVKGQKLDSSLLYWTEDGLYQAESTSVRFTPPLLEAKLPLKPHTEWSWIGTVRISGTEYVGKAVCSVILVGKVTVPAGTFICTVVSKEVTVEAERRVYHITSTDSYARGVGWVKGVLKSGDQHTVTELVSYKLAK